MLLVSQFVRLFVWRPSTKYVQILNVPKSLKIDVCLSLDQRLFEFRVLSGRKFCGTRQTNLFSCNFQNRAARIGCSKAPRTNNLLLLNSCLTDRKAPQSPLVIDCATSKAERVGPGARGLSSKRGRVRAVSGSDLQGLPAGGDFNTTDKNLKGMLSSWILLPLTKTPGSIKWVEFRTNCSGEKI